MAEKSSAVQMDIVASGDASPDTHSYVDWGAILAGAVLAAAIAFVLLTFGSAIGLTLTSPFEGEGASAIVLGIAAALWLLWVQVSSFMAGGYLAGRMRRRIWNTTPHEVEVRDGAHGLMVWAVGALFGAVLAASAAFSVVEQATSAAATVTAASISAIDTPEATETVTDLDYIVGTLFRSDLEPAAADSQPARQEVLGILAASVRTGSVSEDDKSYIARVVAARTDMSEEAARERVDEISREVETAVAKAKEAAEVTRKAAIIVAFFTAASLLVSAAAAWWAAGLGGGHRDEGKVYRRLAMWR